jgi:multiple sugar transport system permease protein
VKNRWGYVFIAPWLLGFLAFAALPFLASVYFSFTRYDIVTDPVWVNLANYKKLFAQDPMFWKSLGITLKYVVVAVPLGIIGGIGLALLLNLPLKGIGIYRTIFYLPAIVPVVASSVVFMWLLNPQIGLVNSLLRLVGVEGPAWLQDKAWALSSLIMMSLWSLGGGMIIYLAGLKDIPTTLYEAAMIDGAGTVNRVRHVTLPLLTPVIFFNLLMNVIGAFQYFTQAYVMTQGGPEDSTTFYGLYLFQRAWKYMDMGYASAMAWILFLVITVVIGLILLSHDRWVHYGR